jgi:hypothetical protein
LLLPPVQKECKRPMIELSDGSIGALKGIKDQKFRICSQLFKVDLTKP